MKATQLILLNYLMLGLVNFSVAVAKLHAWDNSKRKRSVGLYGFKLLDGRAKAQHQELRELTSWSGSRKQKENLVCHWVFRNLKSARNTPPRGIKVILPNSSQAVLPTGDQVSKPKSLIGVILIQTTATLKLNWCQLWGLGWLRGCLAQERHILIRRNTRLHWVRIEPWDVCWKLMTIRFAKGQSILWTASCFCKLQRPSLEKASETLELGDLSNEGLGQCH